MQIKTFESIADLMRWIRDFSEFYLGDPVGIHGEVRRAGINKRNVLDIEISEKIKTYRQNSYSYHISVQLDRPNLFLKKLYVDYPEEMVGKKYYIEGILKFRVTQNKYVIDAYNIELSGKGSIELKREKILEKFKKMKLYPVEKIVNLYDFNEPILNIAVCGSPNTRGLYDFINNLKRSSVLPDIYFYPVSVEGSEAAGSIIRAINDINDKGKAQVICIVRGGGAQSAFLYLEDEECALNILNSKIPVLTGIGHSEDTCLLDIVSKKEFNTPSVLGYEISVTNNKYVENFNFLRTTFLKNSIVFMNEKEKAVNNLSKLQKTNDIDFLLDVYYKNLWNYKNYIDNSIMTKINIPFLDLSFEKINSFFNRKYYENFYKLDSVENHSEKFDSSLRMYEGKTEEFLKSAKKLIEEIISDGKERIDQKDQISKYLMNSLFPKNNLAYIYDSNDLPINDPDKIEINDKIKFRTKTHSFDAKILTKESKKIQGGN